MAKEQKKETTNNNAAVIIEILPEQAYKLHIKVVESLDPVANRIAHAVEDVIRKLDAAMTGEG